MNKVIAALGIVALALMTSPAFAAHTGHEGFQGGQRFSGGHLGAFEEHHGFDGHREIDRDRHGRVFIGVSPWFYWAAPPAYAYAPPQSYWYYCPSAGTYYPYVSSCPEVWVPVPAAVQ
jgi:hypothetical protein